MFLKIEATNQYSLYIYIYIYIYENNIVYCSCMQISSIGTSFKLFALYIKINNFIAINILHIINMQCYSMN